MANGSKISANCSGDSTRGVVLRADRRARRATGCVAGYRFLV
jgi:hypothetical protein